MFFSYQTISELVLQAERTGRKISDVVLENQAEELEKSPEQLLKDMQGNLDVMIKSAAEGMNPDLRSSSGLSGGDAYKLEQAVEKGITIEQGFLDRALIKAISISGVNACMGRVVAAPTAGSCGIIPAVLITLMEERGITREKAAKSLFTAAGIGMVIAAKASISGAEGGCQAECGSASAMAAAAAVELMGGTPEMAANACAIALKNVLGLVCDPVAGLVEVPCIKRNAIGTANAITAADLALAGIKSAIPADEVIMAMDSVSRMMPSALRETAEGGLAGTPTGKAIAENILKQGTV